MDLEKLKSRKVAKIGIVAIVVLVIIVFFVGSYNGIVGADEACQSQWSKVQTQYQRRLDLVPNLVNTVKGYATHESQTLQKVISARNNALNVASSETNSAQYEKVQSRLTSAIRDINVVVERYPELKANENFLELQSQLEGTENRIAVERARYAETVQKYNKTIRRFPKSLVAGMFSFKVKEYYTAASNAETAPEVKF